MVKHTQHAVAAPEAGDVAMPLSCQLFSSGLADTTQGALGYLGDSLLSVAADWRPACHVTILISMIATCMQGSLYYVTRTSHACKTF